MAKKRSKNQKKKTAERLKQKSEQYVFDGFESSSSKLGAKNGTIVMKKNASKSKSKSSGDLNQFFGYDVHLIYKDLLRTVVVTAVVIAILVVIIFYT